jgi:sugar phosphate isomerase/epimerase/protein-tyrosine-phosphatase
MESQKKRVLFVCTGNAGRSQIAQALFERASVPGATALSAGVAPWDHLHPVAVRLLEERGFSLAGRHPKHVRAIAETLFDWVILIGDRAQTEAPRFRGSPAVINWDVSDPADADGTGQEEAAFRRSLAMIESRLAALCEVVKQGTAPSQVHLRPGISTCIVRPGRFDPARHLPLVSAAGFASIELNCFLGSDDFPWDRPSRVRELRQIADATGVRIASVHAEGGIGGYRGARSERLAVDLCKVYADLAAELGAPVVTMHAGLAAGQDRDRATVLLRESLEELARHVRAMPCAYAWENAALGLSPAEHLDWIRDLGQAAFGFVLDTGHSNIDRTTEAYLAGCGGLLLGLHLNDNNGKADKHEMPGRGTARWGGLASRLEQDGYVGPLTLEVEARDRQAELETALAEARASIDLLGSRCPAIP